MECYASKLIAYNTITGESFPLSCRSYSCPLHGAKNRYKLREALLKYLSSWKTIRFWTFTLSNKSFEDSYSHLKSLSKIWRYFITELRRNKIFTPEQKLVQYVRFLEPHQSGYFHFHAVFSKYVPFHKVHTIWCHAVERVTGLDGSRGGCHVKGIKGARNTSYYIVKYITKSSNLVPRYTKLWTKSNQVAFFPKKQSPGTYAIFNSVTGIWYGLKEEVPLLVHSNTHHHINLYQYCLQPQLFGMNSPP